MSKANVYFFIKNLKCYFKSIIMYLLNYRKEGAIMKRRRVLFFLNGSRPPDIAIALKSLDFKGLVTIPYGTEVTPEIIKQAFENNKSLVCYEGDYPQLKQSIGIHIYVVSGNYQTFKTEIPTIFIQNGKIEKQFEKIAENFEVDIGDHRSNSSGIKGAQSIQECAYCNYLKGNPADNGRTVYESRNFIVLPTIGQFIDGYLLIIPKSHVMSVAELTKEELLEFKEVLEDTEFLLKISYGRPNILIWENGTGNGGIGKAKDSVVHAHVHLVPSTLTSESIKIKSGFQFDRITIDDISNYSNHSYLLIREENPNKWIINNSKDLYIPRQYIRQLLAEENDIPGELWNWRKYPCRENLHKTIKQISYSVNRHWINFPKRLQERTKFLLA